MLRTFLSVLTLVSFLALPSVAQSSAESAQEPGHGHRIDRLHRHGGERRSGLGEHFRRRMRERIERNPVLRERLHGRLEKRLDRLHERGRRGHFERRHERFDQRLDRRERLRGLFRERRHGDARGHRPI